MSHAFFWLRLAVAGLPAVLSAAGWCGPALAQRDSVADALAGHQAEMRQLGEGADPLRRPLFFDPVDIESTPQGVPCDHLARRRPDVIAGQGAVVLMETIETRPRRIRFWQPPGADAGGAAEAQARAFARQAAGHETRLLGARTFLWCR